MRALLGTSLRLVAVFSLLIIVGAVETPAQRLMYGVVCGNGSCRLVTVGFNGQLINRGQITLDSPCTLNGGGSPVSFLPDGIEGLAFDALAAAISAFPGKRDRIENY